MRKRLLSFVMAIVMLVGLMSALGVTAMAVNPLPNFKLTSDGIVSWDHAPDAQEYYLQGLSEGGNVRIRKDSAGSINRECTEWTDTGVKYDLQQYLDRTLTHYPGTYYLTIVAVRNGYQMEYLSSFQFVYASKAEQLARPENVRWDGTTARWDAVPNAEKYTVFIYETPGNGQSIKSVETDKTSVSFDKELFSENYNYSFTVCATAKGFFNSEANRSNAVSGAELLNLLPTLSGTVTVTPSRPRAGETLTANLGGALANIPSSAVHYQWQRSPRSGSQFTNIAEATGATYTIPSDASTNNSYRLVVTADRYDGSVISNSVQVTNSTPILSGTITVTPSNPKAGDTLTPTLSGVVADISFRNLSYQWQSSTDGVRFSNIRLATNGTYTVPTSAENGTQYRLTITASVYDGTLYSNVVTVGGSAYQKGDVNRDGDLDNADLILVARYVVNLITFDAEAFKLGDMDDSGEIDNADIIRLARLLVGLS